MGLFSKIFGREDAATRDARRIYDKVMAQARQPFFYGSARVADSYDGRIDVLTLHISAILTALNTHGTNGERLGQALFDVMKDDFEIALREEGLSDASVKKRITPMIALFYDRVRRYAEVLHTDGGQDQLEMALAETLEEASKPFSRDLTVYLSAFDAEMKTLSLGQIAMATFTFPPLGAPA